MELLAALGIVLQQRRRGELRAILVRKALEHVAVLGGADGVQEAEGPAQEGRETDAEDGPDVALHGARDDAVLFVLWFVGWGVGEGCVCGEGKKMGIEIRKSGSKSKSQDQNNPTDHANQPTNQPTHLEGEDGLVDEARDEAVLHLLLGELGPRVALHVPLHDLLPSVWFRWFSC